MESSQWNNGVVPDLALAASVLATKLHVPRAQPGFVPRPRLTARLDEGLARGVSLVCAPAGSGKSSLVAAWARAAAVPVAWLSLDPGDNDPARFWRHVVAALDLASPGLTGPTSALLSVSTPPPPAELVAALLNELAGRDGEVVLVLDDYHVIDSPELHGSLVFLLDHLPAGLRVVLVSRSDPPLPLARLRAKGQLAEVRPADLRFTVPEAAALLLSDVEPGGDAEPGERATRPFGRDDGRHARRELRPLRHAQKRRCWRKWNRQAEIRHHPPRSHRHRRHWRTS